MFNRTPLVFLFVLNVALGCQDTSPKDNSAGRLPASTRKLDLSPRRGPVTPPPPRNAVLEASARAEIEASLRSEIDLVRVHAVEAARDATSHGTNIAFVQLLDDKSPVVRFATAMALGDLQSQSAGDALLQRINDDSPSVRIASAYALARAGDNRFLAEMKKGLLDPRPAVRGNACLAIGRLGDPAAAVALEPLLRDSIKEVRLQAAEALWRLGNERGLKYLVAATISPDAGAVKLGLLALAAPKDPRAATQMQSFLADDDHETVLVAARAMGIIGDADGYSLAIDATRSDIPRVRTLAAAALGDIAHPQSLPALAPLLKDPDPDTRLAASAAILKLRW